VFVALSLRVASMRSAGANAIGWPRLAVPPEWSCCRRSKACCSDRMVWPPRQLAGRPRPGPIAALLSEEPAGPILAPRLLELRWDSLLIGIGLRRRA